MDNGNAAVKSALRKVPEGGRKPREARDTATLSAVVRRTIIFPSESKGGGNNFDLNALLRRNSQARKRRSAGTASLSNRSVHDRAPTPPPPRSPTKKRFSSETTPPLPQMPGSLSSQTDNSFSEQTASNYDSMFEPYGNGAGNNEANGQQALQVIELANGETIWSIVNGLRDDDDFEASGYMSRNSFDSEYSYADTNAGSPQQPSVKGHSRGDSRGSISSFVSRKKSQPSSKQRPETKVFYSSSAQIGRLIENLSQGVDAGSFNFLPNRGPAAGGSHSHSSSLHSEDIHWTVEERLEHMLGSMNS